uniref:hydroxymethylbilane synthase n=1 Tax=Oxyrrhis marina TaxID=2969 RepID=B3U3W9_OXYMA|nr:hydroxymethylbilane synthetase [Oxyrrhis marina]
MLLGVVCGVWLTIAARSGSEVAVSPGFLESGPGLGTPDVTVFMTACAAGLAVATGVVGSAGRLRSRRPRVKPEARLRIGTRGSPLALAQARDVESRAREQLQQGGEIDICVISTEGDRILDRALADVGGKGLFTKELDRALLSGEVDCCVHSMKDVPTTVAPGTEIVAYLPREDTRDVFLSAKYATLADLPDGAVVGTASLRRQAQILAQKNVVVTNFRGNVQTRLRKLAAGTVDCTFLAYAGLKRLGMLAEATQVLEWSDMLPAIAQGAVGIQIRSNDAALRGTLSQLDHEPTRLAVETERAFLRALDGSCRTPIAGQAWIGPDSRLAFRGQVLSADGKQRFERVGDCLPCDGPELGKTLGDDLRREAGEEFFAELQRAASEHAAANAPPARVP